MTHRAAAFILLILGFSSVALPVRAQGATAEELFRAGRAAADAGDHRTACERFAESNRLEPAVGTWLNLGICSQHLNDFVAARQHYARVLQAVKPNDPRYEIAQRNAREVEQKLASVTLVPSNAAPAGLAVRVGEADATSSLRTALPMNPGRHEIVVTAPDHEPRSYQLTLAEGERKELEVQPGKALSAQEEPPPSTKPTTASAARPVPPRKAAAPEREPEPRGGAPTLGYVLGGTGVVLLGVSGATALLVLDRKQTVEDLCVNQRCRTSEGTTAAEEGETFSTISTVTFFAGASALGAGVYFLLSAGDSEPAQAGSFRLSPLLSHEGAALDASLRF